MPKFKVLTGGKKPTADEARYQAAVVHLAKVHAEITASTDHFNVLAAQRAILLVAQSHGIDWTVDFLRDEAHELLKLAGEVK